MKSSATYRASRRSRYAGVAGALVLMLLLTSAGRLAWVAHIEDHAASRQREVTEEALAFAQRQFGELQAELLERAQSVAEAPVVLQALQEEGNLERLVAYCASLSLPRRTAVEVYDTTARLVAWQGYSMPGDSTASRRAPQVTVAGDRGVRQALVAWWPVRADSQVVGTVRVMHLVRFQAPLQNQYLSDYSLSGAWSQATGLTVHVHLGPVGAPAEATVQGAAQLLRGRGGDVLGRVAVEPPPAERLVEQARERFDDVAAFWATLLLFWIVAGCWMWYHQAAGRTEASVHRHLLQTSGRFGVAAVAWWSTRYALLALQVPDRWLDDAAVLAPLFDPVHLASTLGGGLMRSTGDLLITGGFAFLFAAAFLDLASHFRNRGIDVFRLRERLRERSAAMASPVRLFGVVGAVVAVIAGVTAGLAVHARHAVLDSTLDFFARTGLLPEPLVLVVFCALLLLTIAAVLVIAGLVWIALWFVLRYWPTGWSRLALGMGIALSALGPLAVLYGFFEMQRVVEVPVVVIFLATGTGLAIFGFVQRGQGLELLTLRRLLPSILLVTVLLYPLLYEGMDAHRRARIVAASESFGQGRDDRVLFAIGQVLEEVVEEPAVRTALAAPELRAPSLDSLAAVLVRGSLLSSLGTYKMSMTIFDDTEVVGRYVEVGASIDRAGSDTVDLGILRDMYAERGASGPMVEQMTGRLERDRFQYVGLVPIRAGGQPEPAGWVAVRAEPQAVLPEAGTPFPRVLLPSGYYEALYVDLSLAEFQEGVLVRSLGRDFGRYRLSEDVQAALVGQSSLWQSEQVKKYRYLTFYRRQDAAEDAGASPLARTSSASIIAVRVPAIIAFDHLYYVLRLAVAGLCMGGVLYLLGLYVRWRRGLLPAPRVRFRDKVQNAFLVVGAAAVIVVGFVGLRVLRGENERATQNWLQQRLDQVEEMLAVEARGQESPFRVVERIRLDSLAARVGLDLNLYEEARLVASSRPRLVREQLIGERLPAEVYEALYFDGARFATTQERVGSFRYMAGYRALTDEQGQPRYVLSVPTLPEQERIEEEQARTVAYLFGALLLLGVVVLGTASLLAGALTRPLARLRAGLEAVGKGQFARRLPVDTRDEIGELVETFNEMRDQLAESRRKLAQQERELAWREMARQVAHEIKNPLTPMKLSVQHLRRAHERLEVPEPEDAPGRFEELFDRITATLIEQIDTLAHIANEFSTFARMPTRVLEPLDLNAVAREAVALMQEEGDVEIVAHLHPEPLVVEADPEELRRVYINLVKNAIQAIPTERAGQIVVETALGEAANGRPGWARSAVRDNGAGIPRELRDKIFQPNFSTKSSGTGLGLAITKKSIEEMRGEIGFVTEEGAGTTFWIRLPLAE